MTRTIGSGGRGSTLWRRGGLLAALLLVGTLAIHGESRGVNAQPAAPQAAATCRGQVILPLGAVVSPGSVLHYSAQGLEANAPYTIFIGGQAVSRATTSPNGTTGGTLAIPSALGSGSLEMQVTTASSCASTTLAFGGFTRVNCSPYDTSVAVDCASFGVGFGFFPGLVYPGAIVPVGFGGFGFPTRTCVLPGSIVTVLC